MAEAAPTTNTLQPRPFPYTSNNLKACAYPYLNTNCSTLLFELLHQPLLDMGLFSKKDKSSADDDSNRRALFGSKSKESKPSTTAPSNNPYAQPQAAQGGQNPYARPDPYLEAKNRLQGAQASNAVVGGYRDEKAGRNNLYGGQEQARGPSTYGGMSGRNEPGAGGNGGYGANPYGTQAGYGADRYGTGAQATQNSSSRYGAGGYGGLGSKGAYDQKDDENRDALFGGAKDRLKQQPGRGNPYDNNNNGLPPPYDPVQGGSFSNDPYGAAPPAPKYDDREYTQEEQEEQDIDSAKQQIRFMKREDVSSTRNALAIAQRAEEVSRDTLARLGVQGEQIHNTEKNLDLAHNQNKIAQDHAAELKTLNRSMFAGAYRYIFHTRTCPTLTHSSPRRQPLHLQIPTSSRRPRRHRPAFGGARRPRDHAYGCLPARQAHAGEVRVARQPAHAEPAAAEESGRKSKVPIRG